jgi:hypothetical protein
LEKKNFKSVKIEDPNPEMVKPLPTILFRLVLRPQKVINGFYWVKGNDGNLYEQCDPVGHGSVP